MQLLLIFICEVDCNRRKWYYFHIIIICAGVQMKKPVKKIISFALCFMLVLSGLPIIYAGAASVVEVYEGDTPVTDIIQLQEYRSVQLKAIVAESAGEGYTVEWSSDLPLLADVDGNGKVTAYDYSKRAIIQLWVDENIAGLPIVGKSLAATVWKTIDDSGIDIDNTDTDTLVWIVSSIVGESIGESLRTYLDNMNVKITATVYNTDGKKLGSDTVEVVVEKSLIASVAPTGVHITNKKTVPTTVAVGSTVQLFGACTPVRLGQGIKWSVGSSILDTSAKNYASVADDGLVTFIKAGTVTVRVNPESTIYAAFSDTITFTVKEQADLPVEDFTVTGASSVTEGESIQLAIADVTPAGAYKGDLSWSSSDESVAVVDATGLVTGLDGGSGLTYSKSVVITATLGGVSKEFTVKVMRPLISTSLSAVEISGDGVIGIGASANYTATVTPARYNTSSSVKREWGVKSQDGAIVYATSSSPVTDGVISVAADGTVTGIGSGVTAVYVRATYGDSVVTSSKQIVSGKAITDFQISGISGDITEGTAIQLGISAIAPEDYETDLLGHIVWSVEDESVACISESGVLLARDAGGRATTAKRTTTVSATVSGVTRTVQVTVKGQGTLAVNKFSDADIIGHDNVILDFPTSYTLESYPERINRTVLYWGAVKDTGEAPWKASNTYGGDGRNSQNAYISIDDNGTVTPLKAGKTRIYAFTRYLINTNIDTYKDINIIEVAPESITLKAPDVSEYTEGSVNLDLTGMKVYLNYSKQSLIEYYPEAADFTDEQLTVEIGDYTVSAVNETQLDTEQYIIVSVSRAGKNYNAVFPVLIHSKAVESIDITPPTKYEYFEGDTVLSLDGMSVMANYSNAPSETVEDYSVDYSAFDPQLFDIEQIIPVSYTHAGRTAYSSFSVIVYGKPVLTVDVNGKIGEWTNEKVVFDFSSTHELNGIDFYYKTNFNNVWIRLPGKSFTVNSNTDTTYYFKAVNSKGFESEPSDGLRVMIDKVTPSFSFVQEIFDYTNKDYTISVFNIITGKSGVRSVMLGETDITDTREFTVSENGVYTVTVTAGNGVSFAKNFTVENIDKIAPVISSVALSQIPENAPHSEDGIYYSGDVKAVAEYSDSGTSGIESVKYRLVDAEFAPVSEWQEYSPENPALCSEDFSGYFEFSAVDKAGNISEPYYSAVFVRDSDKPILDNVAAMCGGVPYVNDSWADDVVTFMPEATAFSGIKEYYYSVDGGDFVRFTQQYLEAKDDGIHTFIFKAVSNSGLESEPYTFKAKIDRTVPLVRVGFEGTFGRWTSENVTFNLGTLNACPSGVTYYYDCGNGWQKLDSAKAIFTENTNGSYCFKAVNGAGLESAPSDSYKVMIDTAEPSVYVVQSVTEKTSAPYDLAIVPVTGESGVRKIYFNGEDVTDTLKATVSKNGKYILTIIGNNLMSSTTVVNITNFGIVPEMLFSYSLLDETTANITSYNGRDNKVTVPFEIENHDVVELTEGAFGGKACVEEVILQNGIEKIGDVCFLNCENLEKLTIPATVTEIGGHAFDGCTKLTVYGYNGSFAQSYAAEHGIPFIALDLMPVGKTAVESESKLIFTYNQLKSSPEDFVTGENGYSFVGVPSFISGENRSYGTGSQIFVFKDGVLNETYKLIVMGDLDGDATVDVLDAVLAERAANGNTMLYEDYLLAADFDSSDEVEISDFQQVLNISLR